MIIFEGKKRSQFLPTLLSTEIVNTIWTLLCYAVNIKNDDLVLDTLQKGHISADWYFRKM